ncbi:iron-containing redox enzyme family protein [Algibacillus agarilyticus]|uniref:iron-containing redox enzyme family protein n=1 Tax=Algibacillus agarilyticus TaxID=2234133 RepID=UPI0013003B10|nr:iron-containing redox enzyme family protein [Algibacillus agarilyticus]
MHNAEQITLDSKVDWEKSRYYHFLQVCTREELLRSQVPFYQAVASFSQLLLKLASQISDINARLLIIENIWEEHGCGDANQFHTSTFRQHLDALGFDGEMQQNPFVEQWLNELFALNSLSEQFHALAAIECLYAIIADDIAARLNSMTLLAKQTHYSLHSEIDLSHGAELLMSMKQCGIKFEADLFKQAQWRFIELFSALVMVTDHELDKVKETTPIAFYHSRESCNVIDQVVSACCAEELNVLTTCSGGENPMHYLSIAKVAKVTAFDLNEHQLALCRQKLNGNVQFESGRFEFIFAWVRAFFINSQQQNRMKETYLAQPELLKYVIELAFDDRVLNALFTEQATQYSSVSFHSYFKHVYAQMLNEAINNKCVHPNTLNVLFGDLIYNADLNKDLASKKLSLVHATAQVAIQQDLFDIIDLSNIGDWMPFSTFNALVKRALLQLKSGGKLILRRLIGDYKLIDLPYSSIRVLNDNTGFYSETVVISK